MLTPANWRIKSSNSDINGDLRPEKQGPKAVNKYDLDSYDWRALFRNVQRQFTEERQNRDEVDEVPEIDSDDISTPAEGYQTTLLQILRSLPPAGFEKICQRLLRESGFEKVTVTGKSGDGGIDGVGILQINNFVNFRVLFQCKRYSGSVSPSQIRDFRGAMMGRADKGLVLTTGTFTVEAKREAVRDGAPPIELVDGEELVRLFEKQELGLKPRTTYDVDESFFRQFQE
ncbi:MAG: restriction endonuclease [Planctomycetota bacterium]|nr:restriction endonuclease [Planctomycetota bacterium]